MSKKIAYKDKFEKNTYSLIELDTKELQDAFETGNDIIIKGLADDEAVLCTESKTFIIRQVNTSNSLLLVSQDQVVNQYTVCDDLSNTIELKPCLARLNRIDELLSESLYSGSKSENEIIKTKTLYSYHDLLSIVQASENELLEGLEKRGAFQHEGHFRLFERNYLFRLFDSLVTNAILHGYNFGKMTLKEAKTCIREEMSAVDDEEVLQDHILTACINSFVSDTVEQDFETIRFDEEKICRFLGEWLLNNPRNKQWEIRDFIEVWKKLGQDIFTPKMEYLEGLYIMHERAKIQTIEKYIQYFPISELSTDPPQRFAALFAEKPLWRSEEIIPFLKDLAPTKKDQDHLLLKFARVHREKNMELYGSRIK